MADSKQAVAQGRGRDRRGGVFRRRQLRVQGEQEIPENLFARSFHLVCGLRYCEQSVQLLRRNFAARCDRRCTSSQSTQSRALTISPDSHRQSHPPAIPARRRVGPRSNPPCCSGSRAKFTAVRRASSRVSTLAWRAVSWLWRKSAPRYRRQRPPRLQVRLKSSIGAVAVVAHTYMLIISANGQRRRSSFRRTTSFTASGWETIKNLSPRS
jgi:hypothetical protein